MLLLLHGLGATGSVWNGWHEPLARTWPGRWLAPDLPGHGGSPPLPDYTFESLAAGVADLLTPGDRVFVLGHSLGGVLALMLAGRSYDLAVEAAIGLGIKVSWTADELVRAQALARRPVTWFDSRDEAVSRYLRVSGLAGVLSPDDPSVAAGVSEHNGQWRLAMDTGTFGVGAPDMHSLLAGCRAPVTLARGEHDPMNTNEQYERLGVAPITLTGLGHNAHVEAPERVLGLLSARH